MVLSQWGSTPHLKDIKSAFCQACCYMNIYNVYVLLGILNVQIIFSAFQAERLKRLPLNQLWTGALGSHWAGGSWNEQQICHSVRHTQAFYKATLTVFEVSYIKGFAVDLGFPFRLSLKMSFSCTYFFLKICIDLHRSAGPLRLSLEDVKCHCTAHVPSSISLSTGIFWSYPSSVSSASQRPKTSHQSSYWC